MGRESEKQSIQTGALGKGEEVSWYVYKLIDPRDGRPFYIGKGTNDRYRAHISEARSGHVSAKCERIREIEAVGLAVGVDIARDFDFEDQAYAYEHHLIKKIGIANLTNIRPGGGTPRPTGVTTMDVVLAAVRMARVLTRHNEVGIRLGGHVTAVPRETVIKILSRAVRYVCKALGDEKAKAAFARFSIDLVEASEA